jgi:hypothetical protein
MTVSLSDPSHSLSLSPLLLLPELHGHHGLDALVEGLPQHQGKLVHRVLQPANSLRNKQTVRKAVNRQRGRESTDSELKGNK